MLYHLISMCTCIPPYTKLDQLHLNKESKNKRKKYGKYLVFANQLILSEINAVEILRIFSDQK